MGLEVAKNSKARLKPEMQPFIQYFSLIIQL